ncbi:uncharacterized protein ACNS7B_004770 [Menidia menidia]
MLGEERRDPRTTSGKPAVRGGEAVNRPPLLDNAQPAGVVEAGAARCVSILLNGHPAEQTVASTRSRRCFQLSTGSDFGFWRLHRQLSTHRLDTPAWRLTGGGLLVRIPPGRDP